MKCLGKIDPIEIEKKTKLEATYGSFRIKINKEDLESSMKDESWPKGWKIRRFYRNFKTSKNSREKVKEDVEEVKEGVEEVKEDVEKVVHAEEEYPIRYGCYENEGWLYVDCPIRWDGCSFRTPYRKTEEELRKDMEIHKKQEHTVAKDEERARKMEEMYKRDVEDARRRQRR